MTALNGPVAPFDDGEGVWLRCAFHVHTTESDGWLTPGIQRRYHAWAGYDVLAITDHDRHTPEPAGDDDLLIIGGTELSLTAPKSGGPLHLLGIGITSQPVVDKTATLKEAALAVRAAGGLPFLAHPVWSGLRSDEVDGIEECAGMEIFNAGCEVEQDRAHADAHADIWLSMGHHLNLIATDDTHYPGFDAFRAWTMIHAKARTREAVMDSLAQGHFYASAGPRITELSFDDGVLTVKTSPVTAITALSNSPHGGGLRAGHHELTYRAQRLRTPDGQTFEGISDGDKLTGGIFRPASGARYVRITITDEKWSEIVVESGVAWVSREQ